MKYVLSILIALSTVWSSATWALPTNKELNIGITQEFENMNPIIQQMLATVYIYNFVGRKLDVLDPSGKTWIPQLVTKIPTLENGGAHFVGTGKNRKIVANWEIDPKAVWGDGTPITGEDVKFSWQIALSPNVSVGEKEVYSQIEKIEIDKSNPKKFTFTYAKPRYDFNMLGTFYIVPKHLEETPFTKYSKQREGYEHNSLYTANPTNPGLYCGPYIISEIKLGDHVSLVRNPKWWGTPAKIEKINIKLIQNTNTLEANLLSGTIDMISILGFSFDQALVFDKRVKKEGLPYNVNFVPSLTYEHADVQLRKPPLNDVRVRKALVYAINRDDLVKALFENKQKKAYHFVAPVDPWYTEDPKYVVTYPPSKRQAEKLLDEAGWVKKGDGFRYKDGKKLSLTFMTTAGDKVRELVQVFLQNEWKKVGIEVNIKNEPARVFFGETVRKGLYPSLAMFAWSSSPENSPRSNLASGNIPSKANGFSGQNSGGWKNAKVDTLIDELEMEFNPSKRKELAAQIMHYYTDEVPVIPLYYRSDISVTPKNMKGYVLPGHQFSDSNWVENWSLQ